MRVDRPRVGDGADERTTVFDVLAGTPCAGRVAVGVGRAVQLPQHVAVLVEKMHEDGVVLLIRARRLASGGRDRSSVTVCAEQLNVVAKAGVSIRRRTRRLADLTQMLTGLVEVAAAVCERQQVAGVRVVEVRDAMRIGWDPHPAGQ